MKAVEFKSTLAHGGQIVLPPEAADEIPEGEQLRVVVMWEPSSPDSAWRSAGRFSFTGPSTVSTVFERSSL